MEKVKIEEVVLKSKTVEYKGNEFIVFPLLNISQQAFLIKRYVEEYFSQDDKLIIQTPYRYIEAERALMFLLFQISTNIDMESFYENMFIDSVLIEKVTSEISNYSDFREKLERIINDIKEEKVFNMSTGKVLSNFFEKIEGLIEKMGQLDSNAIEQLKETSVELMKKLEESSILK